MQLPVQWLKRRCDTHKGDYGHAFVLGGSVGLTGSICLCAKAVLKIGAGLVTVGIPASLNPIFEIKLTEEMSLPLVEEQGYLSYGALKEIRKKINKFDVVILGPGASIRPSAIKLMVSIIKSIDKPLIVDADAITALSTNLNILNSRKTNKLILTPHLGEFSRLIKLDIGEIKKKRKKLVKDFALRYNLILVLKGHTTLVSDGKEIFENNTGNPGMATAGMGDILAGIITGLVVQGLDCFEAAKIGVHLHGLSADYAVKDKTETCLIASDVLQYLPEGLKSFQKEFDNLPA
ncbi:MAG: NAD(P)H-hydrate dehydratase [Candidatus Omnitrophica bacterium]|nr:NAD(P)H-hydrate dehydratase [Candidatus Omnitrophota bacterium]